MQSIHSAPQLPSTVSQWLSPHRPLSSMQPPLHGVPGGGRSFPLPDLSPVSKYVPVHLRGSIISKVASRMLWFRKMEITVIIVNDNNQNMDKTF